MARRTLPIFKNLTHCPTPAPFLPKPDPNTRSVTYMPRPGDGASWPVTLIPGDGIGPLVTNAVEQVMEAMHAPVYFERYDVHGDMKRVPPEVIESIRKNKVCLKGGLKTLVGGGVSSLNVQLRKELDLYVQRRREMEERSTGVSREPGIGQRNSVGDCGFEVSDGNADDNL